MISALPDIKKVTLTDKDSFMILACDGIWNSLNSDDVCNFIKERLGKHDKLSKICEEVGGCSIKPLFLVLLFLDYYFLIIQNSLLFLAVRQLLGGKYIR